MRGKGKKKKGPFLSCANRPQLLGPTGLVVQDDDKARLFTWRHPRVRVQAKRRQSWSTRAVQPAARRPRGSDPTYVCTTTTCILSALDFLPARGPGRGSTRRSGWTRIDLGRRGLVGDRRIAVEAARPTCACVLPWRAPRFSSSSYPAARYLDLPGSMSGGGPIEENFGSSWCWARFSSVVRAQRTAGSAEQCLPRRCQGGMERARAHSLFVTTRFFFAEVCIASADGQATRLDRSRLVADEGDN